MTFRIVVFLLLAFHAALAEATSADDSYIAGYASAMLRQEIGLAGGSIHVRDGVITVTAGHLRGAQRDRIISALMEIPGVRGASVGGSSLGCFGAGRCAG